MIGKRISLLLLVVSIMACREKEVSIGLTPCENYFSYQLLDSGLVQFNNTYPSSANFKWIVESTANSNTYYSLSPDPFFKFESNDLFQIGVSLFSELDSSEIKCAFEVEVNSAFQSDDTTRIYGHLGERSLNNYIEPLGDRHFFPYVASENIYMPVGAPGGYWRGTDLLIIMSDFNEKPSGTPSQFIQNIKPGIQSIAKFRNNTLDKNNLIEKGWYFGAIVGVNGGAEPFYMFGGNDANEDQIEILEIVSKKRARLFPEMDDDTVWITWHLFNGESAEIPIDVIIHSEYIFLEKQNY